MHAAFAPKTWWDDRFGRPDGGRASKEVQDKIRAANAPSSRGHSLSRDSYLLLGGRLGETQWISAFTPIRNDRGEIIFLHPTGVDITDIKTAETKYRTLSETLESQGSISNSGTGRAEIERCNCSPSSFDCCRIA